MTQTSFYGDTPNFATDYPTQNDGAPTTGNTPAPSSFYPNGGGYVPLAIADDVLAEIQALVTQADTDAANAASSAAAAAASAAAAATAGSAGTITPLADGTAAVGTSTKWAHEDHVHPTDTSRAPLASPALTGTPTAPTASPGTSTTQLATTSFTGAAVAAESSLRANADAAEAVLRANADALLAPLASPTFTGAPAAPTPTAGDNSTKLATTAFVLANAAPLPGAWTAWAPTVTPSSGAFTSVSAAGGYSVSGKTVTFSATITITTVGTASGTMSIPLPVGTAKRAATVIALETAVVGFVGYGRIAAGGSSIIGISKYDNNSYIGAGYTVTLTGTYELT